MRQIARPIGLVAALAAGVALSACRGPHPHAHAHARPDDDGSGPAMSVAATLTCPQTFGGLTRTAQAADGQSCDYRGPGGEQVSLMRLVLAAGQTPQAALAPTEAALRPLIPARPGSPTVSVDAKDDSDDDHAKVDLPGIHVNANGDKADVKVFGVTVKAEGDDADVHVGHGDHNAVVKAGPDGAEVRAEDVGDASVNLALILASDHPGPSGLRAVGYLARGPARGPLAVATFKASARHSDWRGDHDLNGLLALNVKQ
ncbi:MAG: hypothetical protein P4L73_17600 [Caulobacteraceae bacterium]|nr:hypothetical protein [Caulobacteraceae bacterium]